MDARGETFEVKGTNILCVERQTFCVYVGGQTFLVEEDKHIFCRGTNIVVEYLFR